MIALLENHKEAIAELCRNYSIQRLSAETSRYANF
jgi:hypothetical protein